jgi:hypothetical protein
VRGDKQKAAGKKERRLRRLEKAGTHSEREDPQLEAKKEIKARKWIRK